VIADIELPGMSGIGFIVHSKVAQPVASTLMVSGPRRSRTRCQRSAPEPTTT
jgi:hypothetical protein